MTRGLQCPLCASETQLFLQLRFGAKMNLPTEVPVRFCATDNFLFAAAGGQEDYDQWYKALANDSYHDELATPDGRSLVAIAQHEYLTAALGDFFAVPRKVLDFGCGQASLLIELAQSAVDSQFWGYDPSPGAQAGAEKAARLRLENVHIAGFSELKEQGPFDLLILSHVTEHLFDFDLLNLFNELIRPDGLLYLEVPNALKYEFHERQEFLFYFDRLHVNHFTPQSLQRLAERHGFGYQSHFEYVFPYRDRGQYPGLGVLFRKGEATAPIVSPSLREAAERYVAKEKLRSKALAAPWKDAAGVLIWGAGDNFYRSSENGGPLCGVENLVVMDRNPRRIQVGGKEYFAVDPVEGMRKYSWPVVIAVSAGRDAIRDQVRQLDPERPVFYL